MPDDVYKQEERQDVDDKEAWLTSEMEQLYWRLGRATGHWPSRYLQMVRRRGGLACAKALLARPLGDRLDRVRAAERLDISVEALVLDARVVDLFTPQERAIARGRLTGDLA
jgi:hypothetical protein